MLFKKIQIIFKLIFIILFQLTGTSCRFNLYDTNRLSESNNLEFDCLNYLSYRSKVGYQELKVLTNEMIRYCFRPENITDRFLLEDSINPLSQNLSFEELRLENITSYQLLLWSVSIDIAEQYQLYLNEPHSSLNQYFYNCTEPWFGLRCQYSFDFSQYYSFNKIVENQFLSKKRYFESFDMTTHVPCYVLISCHRGGQVWCLDWREVCDGNIDCYDEGSDEEFCFNMVINECQSDEYRCHNGLCIPEQFWEEEENDVECLDRSDELETFSYTGSCFQDPTFRCEEHSCRKDLATFPCGDGHCVIKFTECANGRHELLINMMATKSNLAEKCRIAMVCSTHVSQQVDGILCEELENSSSIVESLKECDSSFQFPTVPFFYDGNVRFFYENVSLRDLKTNWKPDYVCYDQQLCDSIKPAISYKNLSCVDDYESFMDWTIWDNIWAGMSYVIELYFRFCLVSSHPILNSKFNYSNHSSLYQCENSRKVISTHWILDNMLDCPEGDDEAYQHSCALNHRHRIRCPDENKCWSPLVDSEICQRTREQVTIEIPFQRFCDGIPMYMYFFDNTTILDDESGCLPEWCDNIYARCDGFWSCSDGRDEKDCIRTTCEPETFPCISPDDGKVKCLPPSKVNDNEFDCLGATDEQSECRSMFISANSKPMFFQCDNGTQCLKVSQICNKMDDCHDEHDEKFCTISPITCNKYLSANYSEAEGILCGPGENKMFLYFSVHTSSNYPQMEKNDINEITEWPIKGYPTIDEDTFEVEPNFWPWKCNRGLIVRTWSQSNNDNKVCMCPPSYYGDQCQYENQRISLTLRLTTDNRLNSYEIVSMLIDDDDDGNSEIDAYDQFVYIPKEICVIKLNRYLLFPTRPKNYSKSYNIRIDVFEKTKLIYVGSWHFSIDFLFLPVNRLAIALDLSNHLIETSPNCAIPCYNGSCTKYLNKNKYFCRCFTGWSGINCDIPINCQSCYSRSLCIGSSKNQPICVCPINKFGPRCLLESTCPVNACENNGRCVPADVTIPESHYRCICSDEFFGARCQYVRAKISISLKDINVPSYLIAYFFTLSNESDPISTTMLRKLTLFQSTVTFKISIVFHLVIIQINNKYYLAALQHPAKLNILTSINPKQECLPSESLFDSTVLKKQKYERIVYYYELCGKLRNLNCFIDDTFLCLCTNDHHANCLKFTRYQNFQCPVKNYCQNQAHCLQDHPSCPSTKTCLCPECFFGNQCQFYAKGLGSTLDEILGYEFNDKLALWQQSYTINTAASITMNIFFIGTISSILSLVTFSRKKTQEVGCGIYILASSITSLLIMILFMIKFWFLFLSHQNFISQQSQKYIQSANCLFIEPTLKIFLYLDNWLSACIAMDRTIAVYQGSRFDKSQSKRIAKYVVILLLFIISSLFIPQLLNLQVFEDEFEERSWCVIKYSPWLQTYAYTLIFFHYFTPLIINLFSAIFIILLTASQRVRVASDKRIWTHIISKLKHHKHLIISPAIVLALTVPYLIISIKLDCNKSSNLLWVYLIAYFLSYLPATLVFIIFVLPSKLYKAEFKEAILSIQRRFHI